MELNQVSFAQMSLLGAVLIIAIIVVRAAVMNRLPKMTLLVMWEIAILRLCIPYNLSFTFFTNTNPMKTLETMKENVSNTAQNISQAIQMSDNQTTYSESVSMGESISILWIVWLIGVLNQVAARRPAKTVVQLFFFI